MAIGAKLVEDGARVLYIDLDPQMNLSTTLKAQTGGVLSSLDVLTGEAAWPLRRRPSMATMPCRPAA